MKEDCEPVEQAYHSVRPVTVRTFPPLCVKATKAGIDIFLDGERVGWVVGFGKMEKAK